MNRPATAIIFLIITLSVIRPGLPEALAASTNGCHCFRDRAYDPARKFAADDYLLATSFNSLLARAYDLPKKQIVMLKMRGEVDQDELLIAMRAAKVTGADAMEMLKLRDGNYPWREILSSPAIKGATDDPLLAAIRDGLSEVEAGRRAADLLLAGFFGVPLEAVGQLRASGLGEKEMALAFLLAHQNGSEPGSIVEQFQKEGRSWSEIAAGLNLDPAEAGRLMLNFPARGKD